MFSYFIFCETDGDNKNLKGFTKYLYSTCMTKQPSRKVMNFRHLLGCDTIASDEECSEKTGINAEKYVLKLPWKVLVLEK